MFKFLNTIEKKSTRLLALTAIVFALYLVLSILSTIILTPTQSHKSVAVEMSQIAGDGFSEDYLAKIDSKAYQDLAATPEAKYMDVASIVTSIFSVLINITLTVLVYGYLRKYRVTKHAVGVTVAILTVSIVLSFIVLSYFDSLYIGFPSPNPILTLAGIAFLATFGALVQYLVTRVIQWNYNRRHSFIVE